MGYWGGSSFIPLDFSSYERALEADMSKIECGVKMFKRAVSQGFMIDYVLMDSWFTCDSIISTVLSVKKQTVQWKVLLCTKNTS